MTIQIKPGEFGKILVAMKPEENPKPLTDIEMRRYRELSQKQHKALLSYDLDTVSDEELNYLFNNRVAYQFTLAQTLNETRNHEEERTSKEAKESKQTQQKAGERYAKGGKDDPLTCKPREKAVSLLGK